MTYPFPREFKDKIEKLPGSDLLRHERVKQLTAQAVQFPVYARSLKAQPDRKKFVVFGQGRTGSTLLIDLLNTNPEIYCDDELFFYKLLSPVRYVEGKSEFSSAPVYGFKAKIYQLSDVQDTESGPFLRQLSDKGWTIIHIERENLLRHSLSAVLAEQRQVYKSKDLKDRALDLRDHVPIDALLAEMKQREIYRDQEAEALDGLDYVHVGYERDLSDGAKQQASLNRVFEALGVPEVEVATSLKRINSPDLRDNVTNYDEMVAALDASGYGMYLVG